MLRASVGRRHLQGQFLDDPSYLADLLGIALGELARPDRETVLEADADIAAHYRCLGAERNLVPAGAPAPTRHNRRRTTRRRCVSYGRAGRPSAPMPPMMPKIICTNSGGFDQPDIQEMSRG